MLIAEDLLLLFLDDDDGKLDSAVSASADFALAGALLAELDLMGAAVETPPKNKLSSGRVAVAHGGVSDQLLLDTLDVIAPKERSASSLLSRLVKELKLRETLLARLVDRGIVEETSGRFLLIFERSRWPAVSVERETEVRSQIEAALFSGETPDQRTAILIGLLHATATVHRLFPREDVKAKQIKARSKEIGNAGWAGEALVATLNAIGASAATTTTATVI